MSKSKVNNFIYFDNNATTLMSNPAKTALINWLDCYNPSSDSRAAKPARDILEKSKDALLAHCGVSSASHSVIFTSGASESNCFILRACVKAFKKKLLDQGSALIPHVILSATEHHSSIACVTDLMESGDAEVTFLEPTIYGNINPTEIERAITTTTCLISIMYANNEVPVINDIKTIGSIAHKHHIPLHSDAVQVFGKYPVKVNNDHIDALSASAHKFYGPKGVGVLILNNDLIAGYKLTGEINGNQQQQLRGGTENVPGIVSTMAALQNAFTKRKEKNQKLYELRIRLLDHLKKKFQFADYISYLKNPDEMYTEDLNDDSSNKDEKTTQQDIELISLGPPEDKTMFILPNTVLLAICKNRGRPFCNVELKKYLDKHNCIISIGSACNTSKDTASHVLNAIGAPPVVKRGTVRISFGDYNNKKEVDHFAKLLIDGIMDQCKDL